MTYKERVKEIYLTATIMVGSFDCDLKQNDNHDGYFVVDLGMHDAPEIITYEEWIDKFIVFKDTHYINYEGESTIDLAWEMAYRKIQLQLIHTLEN